MRVLRAAVAGWLFHAIRLSLAVGLAVGIGLPALSGGGAVRADPGRAEVERQLAAAWHQLEGVIEQYNGVREDLRATTGELAVVAAELERLGTRLDYAQKRTGELSAAMYQGAHVSSVSALLTAPTPDALFDQLTALDHVARAQRRELTALTTTRDEYDERRRALDALTHRQRAQQSELAGRRTTIEADIRRLEQLRGRAYRGGWQRATRGTLNDGYVPAFTPDGAGAAVRFAYQQIGKVYRYGAEGPDAYDCSGLTMAAWKNAGVRLPHNAARQRRAIKPITREELQPGDLIFYYRDVSHVAMYIGDGRVIEAPQHGERVAMRPLDFAPIVGYGRPA